MEKQKPEKEKLEELNTAKTAESAGTEAKAQDNEDTGNTEPGKKRLRTGQKIAAAILCIVILAFLAVLIFSLSMKYSNSPAGYWVIESSKASDVTMTTEDAETMGLARIGSFKLNKSGSCVIELFDEEFEGTWTQSEKSGTVTIKYGEEGVIKATIDEEGNMTAKDKNEVVYKLKK